MSRIIQPFAPKLPKQEYTHEELIDCVCIPGGPPCVITETFGDEAIIRSVVTGEQFCVQKKDLIEASFYVR